MSPSQNLTILASLFNSSQIEAIQIGTKIASEKGMAVGSTKRVMLGLFLLLITSSSDGAERLCRDIFDRSKFGDIVEKNRYRFQFDGDFSLKAEIQMRAIAVAISNPSLSKSEQMKLVRADEFLPQVGWAKRTIENRIRKISQADANHESEKLAYLRYLNELHTKILRSLRFQILNYFDYVSIMEGVIRSSLLRVGSQARSRTGEEFYQGLILADANAMTDFYEQAWPLYPVTFDLGASKLEVMNRLSVNVLPTIGLISPSRVELVDGSRFEGTALFASHDKAHIEGQLINVLEKNPRGALSARKLMRFLNYLTIRQKFYFSFMAIRNAHKTAFEKTMLDLIWFYISHEDQGCDMHPANVANLIRNYTDIYLPIYGYKTTLSERVFKRASNLRDFGAIFPDLSPLKLTVVESLVKKVLVIAEQSAESSANLKSN